MRVMQRVMRVRHTGTDRTAAEQARAGQGRTARVEVRGAAPTGARVLGALGAVVLTAGFLTACGDGEEPSDAEGTGSSAPTTSAPAQSAPAESPSASPSDNPSAEPEATPSDTPSDDAGQDGQDGDAGSDEQGDDATGDGPGEGDEPGDEQGGTDDGENGGRGDDGKDDGKDEEPEEPDHLAYGTSGERVSALQERLQDLGYFITSVDGSFGSETQQAVFALQKAGGLYRDGVVGARTEGAAEDGVVPRARTSSGKAIEIDIDRQLVLAVEDGRVVRIINASSGNGETYEARGNRYTAYTPRGSFAVYRQVNGMHSSTLELGDMWRPLFFTGGIALHGSASVPAFPASHGCVRVSNSAMDWVRDSWGATTGTPVVVY